jgi:hypothetical protein
MINSVSPSTGEIIHCSGIKRNELGNVGVLTNTLSGKPLVDHFCDFPVALLHHQVVPRLWNGNILRRIVRGRATRLRL